ncbi:MAG: DNA translocase FtsK [Eubacterium sp.]|nr:DNA translocase FtsK [Eubacterium sp.]
MASKQTKKNTEKSNAAREKRSTSQKRAEQLRLEEEQLKRERQKARLIGIVIFFVSLLFFFVAVLSGDGVWTVVHKGYIGLFGWFAAIVFPVLTLVSSFFLGINRQKENKMTFTVISVALLGLLISTFIHIILHQNGEPFIDTLVIAYDEAPTTFNGGFFGALLGWLLLKLGKAPAVILVLMMMLAIIVLLSKLTINEFFKKTTKPVRKAVAKVDDHIETKKERRRQPVDIYLPPEDNEKKEKESKKRKKAKRPAPDITVDDSDAKKPAKQEKPAAAEDDVAYDALIEDINNTTKRNREARNKGKTIDDIVKKNVGETDEPEQKEPEQQEPAPSPVPEFTVDEEALKTKKAPYELPPVSILKYAKKKSAKDISNELKNNAELLIDTLSSFGVNAEITDISRGPTVTRYELKPAAGVRISKITNLADDIALNLAATSVRIEAPIPGKAAVGIEIPNSVKNSVSAREIIDSADFEAHKKELLSAGLGKDIAGKTVFCDVAKMPHLLIAGTTGSGKSVCMNSIIVSILYKATPDDVKFLMIDPKKVEFSKYENIPHLLVPVVTDARKASGALGWAVSEMLRRYQCFSDTGVRDISGYNKYVAKHPDMEPMPKIVICIDELADLMMAAPKEVEDSICRLAQMARAAGMHLVIATQRPSVDVITGLIKANISSRIALTVSSQIDSRTILDAGGAEKLLGRGDMLYSPIGANKPLRVQGCFISDEEVEELCEFIKKQGESQYSDEIQKEIEQKAVQEKGSSSFTEEGDAGEALDPLFEKAVEVVLESGRASTSFLQRKLSVGYSRGSKIMDQLEEKGIIGPQDGAKPREIRINMQQWIQMKANGPVDFTAENTEQMSFEDTVDADEKKDAFDDIIDNQTDEEDA